MIFYLVIIWIKLTLFNIKKRIVSFNSKLITAKLAFTVDVSDYNSSVMKILKKGLRGNNYSIRIIAIKFFKLCVNTGLIYLKKNFLNIIENFTASGILELLKCLNRLCSKNKFIKFIFSNFYNL